MAEKRMFSNKVIGSDAFLEMPDSTQNLYFHLSMYADDDGFVDKYKTIMRMTGKKEDDLKLLIAKSFIIPFQSGVIVIKHWRVNNYLRSDRYNETQYLEEKSQLMIQKNGEYVLGIPKVDNRYTQNSIDKNSIDKNSIEYNVVQNDNSKETNTQNIIKEICDYLNQKADTNYRPTTKSTISSINARLNDGYTLEDFKTVIDKKCDEWLGTEWEKYLAPDTLFRPSNFEKYLNQKIVKKSCGFETHNYSKTEINNVFDDIEDVEI